MIIMGIDPGLHATGYGVITATDGHLALLDAGAIRTSPRQPLAIRLQRLYDALAKVIDAHHPTIAALEAIYTHQLYPTTAAVMAHARGVACLISTQRQLQVVDYLPTRMKKALTGNGHASKEQVARMVEVWLGVADESWSADVTDALALAIAHAHIMGQTRQGLHPSGLASTRSTGTRVRPRRFAGIDTVG